MVDEPLPKLFNPSLYKSIFQLGTKEDASENRILSTVPTLDNKRSS
jgi:hypothetical protein